MNQASQGQQVADKNRSEHATSLKTSSKQLTLTQSLENKVEIEHIYGNNGRSTQCDKNRDYDVSIVHSDINQSSPEKQTDTTTLNTTRINSQDISTEIRAAHQCNDRMLIRFMSKLINLILTQQLINATSRLYHYTQCHMINQLKLAILTVHLPEWICLIK